MKKRFFEKMKTGSYESQLFYRGVCVIAIGVIIMLVVFLCDKERLRVVHEHGDRVKEYISWRYADEWKWLEDASMEYDVYYDPIWEDEFISYDLSYSERNNYYEIDYRYTFDSCYITWASNEVIGNIKHPRKNIMLLYRLIEIKMKGPLYRDIECINIYVEGYGWKSLGIDEAEELATDATVFEDANTLLQTFHNKIEQMSNSQRKSCLPLLDIALIAMVGVYLLYFFVPPIEKFQKDDTLRIIRCTVLGILLFMLGMWLGIVGGIATAFAVHWIENKLVKMEDYFGAKVIGLSIAGNVVLTYAVLNFLNGSFETVIRQICGDDMQIIFRLILGTVTFVITYTKLGKRNKGFISAYEKTKMEFYYKKILFGRDFNLAVFCVWRLVDWGKKGSITNVDPKSRNDQNVC